MYSDPVYLSCILCKSVYYLWITYPQIINMDFSSAWLRFVSESVPAVGAGDVWKSALEQLRVGSFEEGIVLFLCPNSGVKTVAQNKQRDLVGLASRAFGVDVRGVFFEIRPDKSTSKKTEVARGAPLFGHKNKTIPSSNEPTRSCSSALFHTSPAPTAGTDSETKRNQAEEKSMFIICG
jgi:hypothetical protein